MTMDVDVVVGGHYGSEGKGHVTGRLAVERDAPLVVRIGGPNAGHTAYDSTGHKWALRQVPVGIVTNPQAIGMIAAGSEIDYTVLAEEMDLLTEAGVLSSGQLVIHQEVTSITQEDQEAETVIRSGTTGKGIGAARCRRLMRTADRLADLPAMVSDLSARGAVIVQGGAVDMAYALKRSDIIVEGVQGFGLGLHSGHYPHVTSSDCTAIDFLAMAQINPWDTRLGRVKPWVVARPYPIRIAGASGPLANETTWEELGLPTEYTTVTKLPRRVGMPDWEMVRRAVRANGGRACRLALTMVDQLFPDMAGMDSAHGLTPEVKTWMHEVLFDTGAKHIGMVTTSPTDSIYFGG